VQIPINNTSTQTTQIKEIIKDTIIYVEIEKETVKNTITPETSLDTSSDTLLDTSSDTTSFLETKYSVSTANIKNGRLNHTLTNKSDDSIGVKVIYKDIVRVDSIITEKEIPIEIKVEVPIRDNVFWYSIILNVIVVMIIGLKLFIKMSLKK